MACVIQETLEKERQEKQEKERQIFIKLENIATPLTSYQVLSFPNTYITVNELISRIRYHYNIPNETHEVAIRLELWTGPLGTKRVQIDNFEYVPNMYDTFWVRGYLVNK
jgi:hypothetical protein